MIIFSRKTHDCWVPPFWETPICSAPQLKSKLNHVTSNSGLERCCSFYGWLSHCGPWNKKLQQLWYLVVPQKFSQVSLLGYLRWGVFPRVSSQRSVHPRRLPFGRYCRVHRHRGGRNFHILSTLETLEVFGRSSSFWTGVRSSLQTYHPPK